MKEKRNYSKKGKKKTREVTLNEASRAHSGERLSQVLKQVFEEAEMLSAQGQVMLTHFLPSLCVGCGAPRRDRAQNTQNASQGRKP